MRRKRGGCQNRAPCPHLLLDPLQVDPWVNLLRGSAQAFSAIMGGVDSVDVLP